MSSVLITGNQAGQANTYGVTTMPGQLRKPLFLNNNGNPEEMRQDDLLQLQKLTLTGDTNGIGLVANGSRIANLGDPTDAMDAVNKQYVDSIAQGLSVKPSVRALADSNQTLTGLPTIDGVALADKDRVLLVGQTDPKQNGTWVVHSGAWARPPDFATDKTGAGTFNFIEEGTTYAEQGWVCTSDKGADKIDTNPLAFTQFTGAGELLFDPQSGLSKQNNTLFLAKSKGIIHDGTGLAVKGDGQTIDVVAAGVEVIGLNPNTPIGGSATTGFTAANLNTLTNGGDASTLHKHHAVDVAGATQSDIAGAISPAPAAGTPLAAGPTGMVPADAANETAAAVIGIASAEVGKFVTSGLAKNVLTGATPGQMYYLAVGGGMATTPPTGSGVVVARVGYALTATDFVVLPQFLGRRAS